VGWTAGDSAGVGDPTIITAVLAVIVTIVPGAGVGIVRIVGWGVGVGLGGTVPGSSTSAAGWATDWARSASRLDMNPVKATYNPKISTRTTIKNPKAYPLFIGPIIPPLLAIGKSCLADLHFSLRNVIILSRQGE
jgi:hypothetical protein